LADIFNPFQSKSRLLPMFSQCH